MHASHPEGCLAQVLQEWALKATSEQPQALGGECSDLGHCLGPCVLTWEIHSKEQRNRISATPHEGCPSSFVLGRQPSQEDSDYCHSTNYRRCRISVLPPNRDEIIYQIKPKVIIFFKEIVKSHILSAYSAE